VIELRVDGTLEKGNVRVQHSWEDSSNNKTGVLARPKGSGGMEPKYQPPTVSPFDPDRTQDVSGAPQPQTPNFVQNQTISSMTPPQTVPHASVRQAVPLQSEDPEIMTHVQKRQPELYRLEIWRGGIRQNVVPIYQKEVVVGRGSKSKPVDISLAGDVEISRRHVVLISDGVGNYWVVNEGRNPAMINNYELPAGQKIALHPGSNLAICSYVLRIQPR
jgi:hypothetical protein